MAKTKARMKREFDEWKQKMQEFPALYQLYNAAITRDEWTLPNGINPRIVARTVLLNTEAIAFNDKDFGPLILPCSAYGRMKYDGSPTGYHVWGWNGYHNYVAAEDAVRILDSNARIPMMPILETYAKRIGELYSLLDRNVEQNRHPYLISGSEEQLESIKDILDGVKGDKELIVQIKDLKDAAQLQVVNLGVNLQTDTILTAINKVLNSAYTILGYETTNADKKERLITDEVSANYGITEANRKAHTQPCEAAAEEMREKLGWKDAAYRFNSDALTSINKPEVFEAQLTGGIDDEETV